MNRFVTEKCGYSSGPSYCKKLLRMVLSNTILEKKKRSEEHTSELQSRPHLVCRLLLEKKKKKKKLKLDKQYKTRKRYKRQNAQYIQRNASVKENDENTVGQNRYRHNNSNSGTT